MKSSPTIALLDHLGGGNLGDDATLDAMMRNVKIRWPDARLVGLSMNPSDTQTRHGIPCYPIRREIWDFNEQPSSNRVSVRNKVKAALGKGNILFRVLRTINTLAVGLPRTLFCELSFLIRSFLRIRSLDLLVISGGGQLLDSWGGTWKYPYTILKWVALAKLSGAKCYVVDVGAGPFMHPLGAYFIKCALLLSDYVSCRDHDSLALVRKIGFSGQAFVFTDLVYSLDIRRFDGRHNVRRRETLVGISPMAYCDPRRYWDKDQKAYDEFMRKLGAFGSQLLRDHRHVRVFSTDINFDAKAIEDLKNALSDDLSGNHPRWVLHDPIEGIDTLLSQMSDMDYVVTCRFHGVVFAHLLNKPVLAISHHPKVRTLMTEFGLEEYCVDIRSVEPQSLLSIFERMVSNEKDIKDRMASKVKSYREMLDKQFDELFSRSFYSAGRPAGSMQSVACESLGE
ncbi:MAG: polysaccharide pyruvyl transferase family protein [Terracidiphilus sp.]